DLRRARIVGQDRDDVALLDPGPALDLQFGQHAAGARRHCDALVGLGAAGEHEVAAVRLDMRGRNGDAERLLIGLGGLIRCLAYRGLMRQEVPRCDPETGRGDETERGDAARFHREFSVLLAAYCGMRSTLCSGSLLATLLGRARSMCRVMSMK